MARERHPPGLRILFFTEMWERFNFYLMIGIFLQYLTDSQKGGLGWTEERGSEVMGSYLALVYLTPFIGGLLADRLFGCRKMIVTGAVLMMLGSFSLAMPAGDLTMFLGLGLLILGNGAFKPNISTLVGNLYPPGSPLRDAGFNIFYMGINLGAFLCNFVAAFVRNYFDDHPSFGIRGWHAAFATAGIGMLFGLLIFVFNYRKFAKEDPDPRERHHEQESLRPFWFGCILPAVAFAVAGWFGASYLIREGILDQKTFFKPPTAAFVGACLPVIAFYFRVMLSQPTEEDRGRVAALLVVFSVVIVFWMTFHLNSTALTLWARDDTNREPNAAIRLVTNVLPEFAEIAPPKYFDNAGKDTPRPAESWFQVVPKDEYEQLKKANKVTPEDGKPTPVTSDMKEKIYANADPSQTLPPEAGHVRLVNTELFQSINAGMVILFTPLVVGFFHFLRLRGKEPSTPSKIGLGLLLVAGAPLLMLLATYASDNSAHKVSAWWLFGVYAIATFGELCLSPMGLSLVTKVSPAKITAFMMGGLFLAVSFGNKLSGIFGEVYTKMNHYEFWTILIFCNLFFAAVVFVLLGWLKRRMGSAVS